MISGQPKQSKSKVEQLILLITSKMPMKKPIPPGKNTHHKRTESLPVQQMMTVSKRPIKTIEIFINRFDQRIEDSYTKLKSSRHKIITLKSIAKKQPLTVKKIQQKKQSRNIQQWQSGKKEVRYFTQQNTFEEDRQYPTLISNKQVSQYINYIYKTYEISDPLSENKRQNKTNIFNSSDGKKSLTTVSSRKRNSLSSFKEKLVMQKNIDLTPFKTLVVQETQTSFETANNSANQQFQYSKLSNGLFSLDYSSRICESGKKDNSKSFTEQEGESQIEVDQVFRYCFACEAHVLEKNLQFHEQICKPLQDAFLKPHQQLLIMLNQKINRLTKQVQKGIVEAQPQKLASQFTNFKTTVSEWIGEIERLGDKQNFKSIHNNQIKSKYNQIKHCFSTNLNNHLQSLSRLRWFINVRENWLRKIKGL